MALLKKFETPYGTISVTRDKRDGALAYYQNGSFHSQADDKGDSICVYIHVLHEIIRQSRLRNILIIGCAGGTLATMLRRQHCKVTIVDINPMTFAIARDYFHMPDDVRCVRRDGIAYLRQTPKIYDAVVVDVFGGDNTVPRAFTTAAFFQNVREVLSPVGLMLMNFITADDRDARADAIARNAGLAGMDVTLFDWPRHKDRNTLIIGGAMPRIQIPSGREPAWIRQELRGMIRRKPRRYRNSLNNNGF